LARIAAGLVIITDTASSEEMSLVFMDILVIIFTFPKFLVLVLSANLGLGLAFSTLPARPAFSGTGRVSRLAHVSPR
jgi:hypothetical protein